jgi:hypothetical protein
MPREDQRGESPLGFLASPESITDHHECVAAKWVEGRLREGPSQRARSIASQDYVLRNPLSCGLSWGGYRVGHGCSSERADWLRDMARRIGMCLYALTRTLMRRTHWQLGRTYSGAGSSQKR